MSYYPGGSDTLHLPDQGSSEESRQELGQHGGHHQGGVGGGQAGGNCIKIGLSWKSILGDYFQEIRISRRTFLLLRICFPGIPIFIQFFPGENVLNLLQPLPLQLVLEVKPEGKEQEHTFCHTKCKQCHIIHTFLSNMMIHVWQLVTMTLFDIPISVISSRLYCRFANDSRPSW